MSFLKDFKDLKKDISMAVSEKENRNTGEDVPVSDRSAGEKNDTADNVVSGTEEKGMSDMLRDPVNQTESDVTVIAAGAVINGDMESEGSIAVYGVVYGNIKCGKKFIASGQVTGDIHAAEIFINKAVIDGEVVSGGNLKIGSGSVVQGDVYGKTAVIAGAVKGEIDIKGPVIIDNTAVVKGNIKSRSVQINNGAVIEGYCTQCYHDVDVSSIFKDTFHEESANHEMVQQEVSAPDVASASPDEGAGTEERKEFLSTEEPAVPVELAEH